MGILGFACIMLVEMEAVSFFYLLLVELSLDVCQISFSSDLS